MKTTTFKAMMAIAFATIAMTANANPKGKTWRDATAPAAPKIEVRNDNRNNRHYEADWKNCRHNHLDRYGNKTFCHNCGAELVWKGGTRNGHYEVINTHAMNNTPSAPAKNNPGAPAKNNGYNKNNNYRK